MDIMVANLSEYEPVWSGSQEDIGSPYQLYRCSRIFVNTHYKFPSQSQTYNNNSMSGRPAQRNAYPQRLIRWRSLNRSIGLTYTIAPELLAT